MITLKGTVGQSLRIPLYSTNLTTGLSLTDLSLDAALDGSYVSSFSSGYALSLVEISSSNYANAYSLSLTPPSSGVLVITINYSSYEETYVIQISDEDISFLAGKIKGSVGDYSLTVKDSSNSVIPGVTVRVYNNAQTEQLHVLKTNDSGTVEISAPAGSYKLVLSKPNFSFSNPKSIVITSNDETAPMIVELLPASIAEGGTIAIKGLHFGTGTQVRFGDSYVTPSHIGKNQDILLVSVPTSLSVSSLEIGIRKSDPNNDGQFLTGSSTLTLGITS